MWRLMNWIDDRWMAWHARGTVRYEWADRHPRLWAFGFTVPSTWLRRPVDGWQSYRRLIVPILLERETGQLGDDTP